MSRKSILSLHETANLIGQWLFGDEWSEALLQEPDNELHKRVREAVRELIASEEVKVSYKVVDHQADYRTHLIKFEDTQHEFFSVNLERNYILLGKVPEPIEPRFHRNQTQEYVARVSREGAKPKEIYKEKYLEQMIDWFESNSEPRTRKEQYDRLYNDIGPLSEHEFKKLRKEAIEKTGRKDLAKPGRRPNT